MSDLQPFTMILIAITFAVLVVGIILMAVGGKVDEKYSNKLMVLRVAFQAAAVILLFILFAHHNGG